MFFRSTALLRTARNAAVARPAPIASRFLSSTPIRCSALGYGDPVEEGVANNSGTKTPPQSKNPGESASTDPEVKGKSEMGNRGMSEGKDGKVATAGMDTPEKDPSGATGRASPEELSKGAGELYDKQTESVVKEADGIDRTGSASAPDERKKVGEAPKKQ